MAILPIYGDAIKATYIAGKGAKAANAAMKGAKGATEVLSHLDEMRDVGKVAAGAADEAADLAKAASDVPNPHCKPDSANCFVAGTKVLMRMREDGDLELLDELAATGTMTAETDETAMMAVTALALGVGFAVARDKVNGKERLKKRPRIRKDKRPGSTDGDATEMINVDEPIAHDAGGMVLSDGGSTDSPSGSVKLMSADNRHPEVNPTCTAEAEVRPQKLATRSEKLGLTLLAIGTIISLLFGVWLWSGGRSLNHAATAAVSVSAVATPAEVASPNYNTVRICEIEPAGYRVLADNPQTPGQAAGNFGEFNRETWRVYRFLMDKPNGGWLRIGLARPTTWIESTPRDSNDHIWLEFEELGIADWATLQATELCPTGILGEGRLVTGTFEHSSGEVLNLFIASESEPIGSTANHPFWSEDRQDFVQAGSLKLGEHLRLADGHITILERVEPVAEMIPVYNLEVDGEHVYFVGDSGVLVHNAGKEYPFDRYGSELEANRSKLRNGLDVDPSKNGKFKNVGDPGAVDPRKLGSKNATDFSHKITFNLRAGAREWLRRNKVEPPRGHGPGTWKIPADLVDEFNRLFVESVKVIPR